MRKLETEFIFAGFSFPRYILEIKKYGKRHSRCVYYSAPKPLNGNHPGIYFCYLGNHGSFNRWKYCDEISRRIGHTGWFCDEFQDDKIRGIVVYLPHGKMLVGWTMGAGMCTEVSREIYLDETCAAYAADEKARIVAEYERDGKWIKI